MDKRGKIRQTLFFVSIALSLISLFTFNTKAEKIGYQLCGAPLYFFLIMYLLDELFPYKGKSDKPIISIDDPTFPLNSVCKEFANYLWSIDLSDYPGAKYIIFTIYFYDTYASSEVEFRPVDDTHNRITIFEYPRLEKSALKNLAKTCCDFAYEQTTEHLNKELAAHYGVSYNPIYFRDPKIFTGSEDYPIFCVIESYPKLS